MYLQYGNTLTVHVKRIETTKPGSASPYQVKLHENLDLTDQNIWRNTSGGYHWTAEKFLDSFRSLEVQKIVFADGFTLPFEDGQLDRSLLLKAPFYKGIHGDFMAEGVLPLTKEETRQLIGEEAWYLGRRVRKTQARAGMIKMLVGAPSARGRNGSTGISTIPIFPPSS